METFENGSMCHCPKGPLGILMKALFSLLLVVLIVGGIAYTKKLNKETRYVGQEIETKNSITVSGQGEIYAKPDLALIDLAVTTESKTVARAMTENTTKMNGIITTLKDLGVKEKDIKSTNFNVSPRYEWPPSGQKVLVGYIVNQSLQVKIRDLDQSGEIIQKAASEGANEIGDLVFTIENKDELQKQARAQAIQKAKTKAEELAKELGVNLARVTGFSENQYYAPYTDRNMGISSLKESAVSAMPQIETGENKIEANISITYEIN